MLKALNKKNNFPIDPFNNVEIVAPSMNLILVWGEVLIRRSLVVGDLSR